MSKFRPPEPLIFEGNLADQWDRWKQQFEIHLIATELTEKAEKIKTSILLTCIGKQGLDISNTFTFSEDDNKMKLKPVMDQFEAYCKPRKNITLLRHNFLTHKQQDSVSFDTFVTELKQQSTQCELGELRDSLVKDMIVIGVADNQLRERLLRTDDLTLDVAIKLGQAAEATKQQAVTLARPLTGSQAAVDVLNLKGNSNRPQRQQQASNSSTASSQTCKYCSSSHPRGKCPAYGKMCSKCHKLNHYASVCLSTSRSVHYANTYQSNDDSNARNENDMEHFFI